MLDYIYMTNLPIYVYILYFIFGVSLNVISHKIAVNNYTTREIPLFVMFFLFLISNFFILLVCPLIGLHLGIYFLISIAIPYAAVWRSAF
ncbi:MAG: hypothetical protein EKK63_08220 [Acinetobacter sp.]|nr:MAG: hypothetical protein EKK63_08220 [Acinetobacter sp.]